MHARRCVRVLFEIKSYTQNTNFQQNILDKRNLVGYKIGKK